MGHSFHFLQRLERADDVPIKRAMELYHRSRLVTSILHRLSLSDEHQRLGISLDPEDEGSFLVLSAEGELITCSEQVLPKGRSLLNETLQASRDLLKESSLFLQVIGHTDWVGFLLYNKNLSRRRAMNMFHFLRSMGICYYLIQAADIAFLKSSKCRKGICGCHRTVFQRRQYRRVEF